MFPVTTCGCPQKMSRSGALSEPQNAIDQDTIDKRLLDDADPARRERYLDQLGSGCTDKKQYMQVGTLAEKLLQKRRATQSRQICFDQQAALLRMQARPVFQERLSVRIGTNLYPVGIQQAHQSLGDRLIRIHNVDRKLVLFQKTLLAPA